MTATEENVTQIWWLKWLSVKKAIHVSTFKFFLFSCNYLKILRFASSLTTPTTIFQHAIKRKFSPGPERASHWLDPAKEKYDAQLVEDTKILLRVLTLFLPLPVFWALFDQQVCKDECLQLFEIGDVRRSMDDILLVLHRVLKLLYVLVATSLPLRRLRMIIRVQSYRCNL